MALINQNKLFDRLQLYIDKKISEVPAELQALFDEYGIDLITENLDEIKAVADNITDVLNVSANIPDISTVASIHTEVQQVAYIRDKVTSVANIDDKVVLVADNEADIDTVATNITPVANVGNNITEVIDVSTNMVDVQTVSTDIAAVKNVSDNMQDVIEAEDHAQAAYVQSRIAEAEAMTSDSYAMEGEDTPVKDYFYDEITDTIGYNELTGVYSSLHWSIKASYSAGGLTYRGTWDSDNCSMPPDDTVNGALYIVSSVTNNSGCPELSVGDWLLWSEADNGGNDSWHVINWTFDWAAITNVPANVSNAVNRAGDTMTGVLKGVTPVDDADLTRKDYVDNNFVKKSGDTMAGPLIVKESDIIVESRDGDQSSIYFRDFGSTVNRFHVRWRESLERFELYTRDASGAAIGGMYIDSAGIATATEGIKSSQAPVEADDLTRKDYVDSQINNAVPAGTIVMWSGTTIPSGWKLCDGNDGTPDLRGKFVLGGDTSTVGNTGGSADAVAVSHSHTKGTMRITGDTTSNNNPSILGRIGIGAEASAYPFGSGAVQVDLSGDGGSGYTWDAGPYKVNGFRFDTDLDPNCWTGNTSTEGEDGTGKNMPPYYTLVYIMKG